MFTFLKLKGVQKVVFFYSRHRIVTVLYRLQVDFSFSFDIGTKTSKINFFVKN